MVTNDNPFRNTDENNASFARRFYIYQKERFPFAGYILLTTAFSFSAIAYSRILRGAEGFIEWHIFLTGIFITITFFFLLRVFDEFKDAKEDAKYRKELAVPRGLISLAELKATAIVTILFQISVIRLFIPEMTMVYLLVMGYLLLMTKEFFISKWLKKRQFIYVTSHMFIVPLVDVFASGLDWILAGVTAPSGLLFFFAVSYMNGIVLEVGRKIKPKEMEKFGVLSYTSILGTKKAVWLWLVLLFATLILSIITAQHAKYGLFSGAILCILFILSTLPAFRFLSASTKNNAQHIEHASAIWTVAMYLSLGGIPMIQKLIQHG